jgi:hypothetical protein
MKDAMGKLDTLMRQNLINTGLSALGGGVIASLIKPGAHVVNVWGLMRGTLRSLVAAQVGIGTAISILPALYNWRRELQTFNRDVFAPARKQADETCRKEAGL